MTYETDAAAMAEGKRREQPVTREELLELIECIARPKSLRSLEILAKDLRGRWGIKP